MCLLFWLFTIRHILGTDCDVCTTDFAAVGGCDLILADEDVDSAIPEGCDSCGPAVYKYCTTVYTPVSSGTPNATLEASDTTYAPDSTREASDTTHVSDGTESPVSTAPEYATMNSSLSPSIEPSTAPSQFPTHGPFGNSANILLDMRFSGLDRFNFRDAKDVIERRVAEAVGLETPSVKSRYQVVNQTVYIGIFTSSDVSRALNLLNTTSVLSLQLKMHIAFQAAGVRGISLQSYEIVHHREEAEESLWQQILSKHEYFYLRVGIVAFAIAMVCILFCVGWHCCFPAEDETAGTTNHMDKNIELQRILSLKRSPSMNEKERAKRLMIEITREMKDDEAKKRLSSPVRELGNLIASLEGRVPTMEESQRLEELTNEINSKVGYGGSEYPEGESDTVHVESPQPKREASGTPLSKGSPESVDPTKMGEASVIPVSKGLPESVDITKSEWYGIPISSIYCCLVILVVACSVGGILLFYVRDTNEAPKQKAEIQLFCTHSSVQNKNQLNVMLYTNLSLHGRENSTDFGDVFLSTPSQRISQASLKLHAAHQSSIHLGGMPISEIAYQTAMANIFTTDEQIHQRFGVFEPSNFRCFHPESGQELQTMEESLDVQHIYVAVVNEERSGKFEVWTSGIPSDLQHQLIPVSVVQYGSYCLKRDFPMSSDYEAVTLTERSMPGHVIFPTCAGEKLPLGEIRCHSDGTWFSSFSCVNNATQQNGTMEYCTQTSVASFSDSHPVVGVESIDALFPTCDFGYIKIGSTCKAVCKGDYFATSDYLLQCRGDGTWGKVSGGDCRQASSVSDYNLPQPIIIGTKFSLSLNIVTLEFDYNITSDMAPPTHWRASSNVPSLLEPIDILYDSTQRSEIDLFVIDRQRLVEEEICFQVSLESKLGSSISDPHCLLFRDPSTAPTVIPSSMPSILPTLVPSGAPSSSFPSSSPSGAPTSTVPSRTPSVSPTTAHPTQFPTTPKPSGMPVSSAPSWSPSMDPSKSPTTEHPTQSPITSEPTISPSTSSPTTNPTESPTYASVHVGEMCYPATKLATEVYSEADCWELAESGDNDCYDNGAIVFFSYATFTCYCPQDACANRMEFDGTIIYYREVPSFAPSIAPSRAAPSLTPTTSPPTLSPSTSSPTTNPTPSPTTIPTSSPTPSPTTSPLSPTTSPTSFPTTSPSTGPSGAPFGVCEISDDPYGTEIYPGSRRSLAKAKTTKGPAVHAGSSTSANECGGDGMESLFCNAAVLGMNSGNPKVVAVSFLVFTAYNLLKDNSKEQLPELDPTCFNSVATECFYWTNCGECAYHFGERGVRRLADLDEAGQKACEKWYPKLKEFQNDPDCFARACRGACQDGDCSQNSCWFYLDLCQDVIEEHQRRQNRAEQALLSSLFFFVFSIFFL